MRDLTKLPDHVEAGRTLAGAFGSPARSPDGGRFHFRLKAGQRVCVIVGVAFGWEHVSVSMTGRSARRRLPSWREMCEVKDLFWRSDEAVVQYHPSKADYVNFGEVLHLWKPLQDSLPLPPPELVGPPPQPAIEKVRRA